MIRRIFLDLDDTCNTLAMHLLRCVGCEVDPSDYRQHPAQFSYEINLAANYLLGEERFPTPADFWQTITREHWATCPASEIFPWVLYTAARLVGQDNICVATSPTKCPESLAGKLDWIHCFMPPWMHRQYAITPRKYLFARSDALLIDDLERNTQRFEQEGGHSILVPRPWNQLWGLDPFEAVEAQLKKFF
jgi:hypothetical protein